MDKSIFNLTPESYCENEKHILNTLQNDEIWRQLPLLNYTRSRDFEDVKLFRFRGMIQDMSNPEIYLQSYKVFENNTTRMQNGKYRDTLVLGENENVNLDCKSNVLSERRTMIVVSIPCQNKWTSECEMSLGGSRDQFKRPAQNMMMEIDSVEVLGTKKIRCDESPGSSGASSHVRTKEHSVHTSTSEFPIKCFVKIYDNFDDYGLNSLVDVLGFLSLEEPVTDSNDDNMEESTPQDRTATDTNLIPTLHAIAIRKLQHGNPLIDPLLSIDGSLNESIEKIQKDLKIGLTQCLFGDGLAADYLLLNLISSIFVRTEMETLGKFCLNIFNIPSEVLPDYTKVFYEIIEMLVPASEYIPLSLENLNTSEFIPKKDYKTNNLVRGLLQLAPHTHLVLDETCLEAGKLETKGIEAVRNLNHLIKSQQVRCDFHFYELNFNVNVPVMILSEGKSMLSSDFQIPLAIDNDETKLISETLKAVKHYLHPKLTIIRKYLTWAKFHEFTVNSEVTAMIEADFVSTREKNKKFGAEDLHKLLVLSRLLGISKGISLLDKETWDQAKAMEIQRLNRLQK